MARFKRVLKWGFLTVLIAYAALVVVRVFQLKAEDETQKKVAEIRAAKLELKDVTGEDLPPRPDPASADMTIEGIDANRNDIRDDVELAIFERYPGNPRLRAAMLQYAMALQMELTKVTDSETWRAAAQQRGRGYGCIFENIPSEVPTFDDLSSLSEWLKTEENQILFDEEHKRTSVIIEAYTKEIEQLALDTNLRKTKYEESNRYTRSFSSLVGEDCDIGKE